MDYHTTEEEDDVSEDALPPRFASDEFDEVPLSPPSPLPSSRGGGGGSGGGGSGSGSVRMALAHNSAGGVFAAGSRCVGKSICIDLAQCTVKLKYCFR